MSFELFNKKLQAKIKQGRKARKNKSLAFAPLLLLAGFLALLFLLSPGALAQGADRPDPESLNGRTNVLNSNKSYHRGFGALGSHLDVMSPRRGRGNAYWDVGYTDYGRPELQSQEKMIKEAHDYGFDYATRRRDAADDSLGFWWIREIEIVPGGQVPNAKIGTTAHDNRGSKERPYIPTENGNMYIDNPSRDTRFYVPDNGTFVPLSKAKEITAPENHILGNDALTAQWTFGTLTEEDQNNNRFNFKEHANNDLIDKYLPRISDANKVRTGDVGLFKDNNNNWYWCINPNTPFPVLGNTYVQEPSRFSSQTGFSDVPQLSYMIGMFNKITDFTKRDWGLPDTRKLYDKLVAYYNDVISDGNNLDGKFPWDDRYTNAEVRDAYERLATAKNKPEVVEGENIRLQSDRAHAYDKLPPNPDNNNETRKDTIALIMNEYVLQHYTQGFPLEAIDQVIGVRAFDGEDLLLKPGSAIYDRESQKAIRNLIRLWGAISAVSTEKDLFEAFPGAYYEVKPVSERTEGTKTKVDVAVRYIGPENRESDVEKRGFILPEGVNLETSGLSTEGDLHVLPKDINRVTFSYESSAPPQFPVRFQETKQGELAGMVFIDKEAIAQDEATGHYIIKEYASWNHGYDYGQQIAAFTPQKTGQTTYMPLYFDEPSLQTQVSVGAKSNNEGALKLSRADLNNPDGIKVKDTISYKHLKANGRYRVEGNVYKVVQKDSKKTVDAHPLATKTMEFSADQTGSGTWDLSFDAIQKDDLEATTSYVVYEKARLLDEHLGANKREIKHEDPEDSAQTFVTPEIPKAAVAGIMTTKVSLSSAAETENASPSPDGRALKIEGAMAKKGVNLTDTVFYKHLRPGGVYDLEAKLYELHSENGSAQVNKETQTPVKTVNKTFTAEATEGEQVKSTQVNFGEIKTLEPGKDYVVFESATLKNPEEVVDDNRKLVTHEDASDQDQTVVVKEIPRSPSITTTVRADSAHDSALPARKASNETPLRVFAEELEKGVALTDELSYSDLAPGKQYKITAKLYRVDNSSSTKTLDTSKVYAQTDPNDPKFTFTAEKGSHTIPVSLGTVTGLQEGQSYVVVEELVSVEKIISHEDSSEKSFETIRHSDANDTSQTLIVSRRPEISTQVSLSSKDSDRKVASNATASVVITAAQAKEGVSLVDTISYERLEPNTEYVVEGKLYQIVDKAGKKSLADVAHLSAEPKTIRTNEQGTATKSTHPEDRIELSFGVVHDLKPGESYVVVENLTSVNKIIPDSTNTEEAFRKQSVSHKDPEDSSQTFVVEGKLRNPGLSTSVQVFDWSGTKEKPVSLFASQVDKAVSVRDKVRYHDLVPGEEYTLTGQLMEIVPGAAPKQILVASKTFVAKNYSAQGKSAEEIEKTAPVETLDFEAHKLEPGKNYVVFETAVSTKNLVRDSEPSTPIAPDDSPATLVQERVVHADPSDKAQTIMVKAKPIIKTTVSADGKMAGSNENNEGSSATAEPSALKVSAQMVSGTGTTVVDTISYDKLEPNTRYIAKGSLRKIVVNERGEKVADPTAIALSKETPFVSSPSGKGSVEVSFGKVKNLQVGESYVVYETLSSEQEIIASGSSSSAKKTKQVLKHEDPSDQLQTIVVDSKPRVPGLSTSVEVGAQRGSKGAPVQLYAEEINQEVNIVDHVRYWDFARGESYTLKGQLMMLEDSKPAKEVASKTQSFVATDSGAGEEALSFDSIRLEPGKKYVVYETAVKDSTTKDHSATEESSATEKPKPVDPTEEAPSTEEGQPASSSTPATNTSERIEHKDPNDDAQSVLVRAVPKLLTTAQANGKDSSSKKPIIVSYRAFEDPAGIDVSDLVEYVGLTPHENYELTGELHELREEKDGQNRASKEVVAKKTLVFTADDSGNGFVRISFGKLNNLKQGAKYVVFESARSEKKLIAENPSDKNSAKINQKIEHRNPNDKAQTILTQNPPAPAIPNKPVKPIRPAQPQNGNGLIPKTGESSGFIAALMLCMGLFVLGLVYKKQKHLT